LKIIESLAFPLYRQYRFPEEVFLLRRWVVQLLLVLVVVERAGCLTTLSTERAHILSTYKQLVTSRSAREHQLSSIQGFNPREGICHGVINIQIPNPFVCFPLK
jgi:hypothetical protein